MALTRYQMTLPKTVLGGRGSAEQIADLAQGRRRITVFCDRGVKDAGVADPILARLEAGGRAVRLIADLPIEPTVHQAAALIDGFRGWGTDLVVGIGGGSTLDIAKLASVLDTDGYTVFDLLDRPQLARKGIPTVMIPTTAGTGAEATPNAIVAVPEQNTKVGIVSTQMVADSVILDAALMSKLPAKVIAASGIDAMSHAIECFTSNKANWFSDLYALEAFALIVEHMERAYAHDEDALEAMLNASFYAGVAITASGTNGVHALAYPLGGRYHITHGIGNAIMLMPVMRFNQPAIAPMLARAYDRIQPAGSAATEGDKADWVIRRMGDIVKAVGIPSDLRQFHVGREDLPILVEAGMQVKRLLVNNMREITPKDAEQIYLQVL